MDTFLLPNADIRDRFKDEIRKRRIVKAQLAEDIGICRSYLTDILNKRFPMTKTIEKKLNDALGTNLTSE